MFAMFYEHALRDKRGNTHHARTHMLITFTRYDQNWSTGCVLVLYGSTYASSSTTWRFPYFSLLSVWAPCYTLSRNCILNTNTPSDHVSLFKFPSDAVLRRKWEKQVHQMQAQWKDTGHSFLCSYHFTEDCFQGWPEGGDREITNGAFGSPLSLMQL